MSKCDTCALQYREACPDQFAKNGCSRYVQKKAVIPQPPKRGGRSAPLPGEYRSEPAPPAPPIRKPKKKKRQAKVQGSTIRKSQGGIISKGQGCNNSNVIGEGQRLFYRNKHTGIIEYGTVVATYKDGFDFMFEQRIEFLDYSMVGSRLFFTHKGARKNYLKTKGQN